MGTLTEEEKRKIYQRRGGTCDKCGKKIRGLPEAELHHKNRKPKDNRPENIRLLHRHCHEQIHQHRP